MRALPVAVVVMAAILATPVQRAQAQDVTIEALGVSRAGPDDANTRALDDAFRFAVTALTKQSWPEDELARSKREVAREVYRRARRFIVSYQLLDEKYVRGSVRVRIRAVVDKAKLSTVLSGLGVTQIASAEPELARARRILVVAHFSAERQKESTRVGADGGIGGVGQILLRALRRAGFEVVLPASGETLARGAAMTPAQAAQLSAENSSSGAIVVSVRATGAASVRGVFWSGCVARARAFVVARDGRLIAEHESTLFGYASSFDEAQRDCLERAASALTRALVGKARAAWPTVAQAGDEQVLVRVVGRMDHPTIMVLEQALSSPYGGVTIDRRSYRRGLVQLVLNTRLSAARVAAILRRLSPVKSSFRVRASDPNIVEVVRADQSAGGD